MKCQAKRRARQCAYEQKYNVNQKRIFLAFRCSKRFFISNQRSIIMKTNRFLSAAISIATAFTFSACSSDDGNTDSGYPNGGSVISSSSSLAAPSSNSVTPSSNSVVPSSNSVATSSSSSATGGGYSGSYGSVNHGGKSYKTVVIGTQTWMAENLNVMHNSGNGDSWCYEGIDYSAGYPGVLVTAEESCAKFGRIYDWAGALDLPDECNRTYCAYQIESPHRGICPHGFHIPTNDEWDILEKYVDPNWTSNSRDGNIAGTKLKATSGWNSEGNGTDDYGFAALSTVIWERSAVGASGMWWSATVIDGCGGPCGRGMGSEHDGVVSLAAIGALKRSVRCVKD
jgi:uncharacterized protein (TIGR02145 family)